MSDAPWVWLNGAFLPEAQAALSPLDRGFLLGDGLFETMRSDNGRVHAIGEHLERLSRSASMLRIHGVERARFADITSELLERNHLTESIARIRITVTRGNVTGPGLPETSSPTILVTAVEYRAPTEIAYAQGWSVRLSEYGTPHHAEVKAVSYLPYALALQAAFDEGFDEALLTDKDGFLAEACAGSILVCINGEWARPASSFQLTGVTRERVIRSFHETGTVVRSWPLTSELLWQAETVWITNSLIGVMPVRNIGARTVPSLKSELARVMRGRLFGNGAG